MPNRLLYLLIATLLHFSAAAQEKSNRGKEFWLGYGFNYLFYNDPPPQPGGAVNHQELVLYISTEQAATVTVSINSTGWSQTLNIPANTADATVFIPKSGPDDARITTDGLSDRGIHIVSDVPVVVYAHQYGHQASGATMLMPVETYGYSYYSVNYYQTNHPGSNPSDWYSWFFVVAAEDNTRIQITPSDTTKNGWLPGQTYTVNLNKGQIYTVFGKAVFNTDASRASKDMTGSRIISTTGADGNCHPVAVFSGTGGIRNCLWDGGEYGHQQVFPAQAWGTRYLTYHTINNTNTDILETNRNIYRVCVQDPSTIVKRNGLPLTGLTQNFFYEFMDSTGGDYIEADKPVLVAQYMVNENQCWRRPPNIAGFVSYGDPEMFYISPLEQGQKAVRFFVARKSTIDYVYANIYVPTAGVSSLLVDGAAVPASQIIPHPNNPAYSVALTRFTGPAASHTITCDSAFNANVYGLGNYESYGYNAGTFINNLNHYGIIKNTFNTSGIPDSFTCPKTPVRLFVKVGYPASSIHWKLSQVAGLLPAADSVISNPVPAYTELINGRTYYVYTLQQDFTFAAAGTYTIPVTWSTPVFQNCSQSENAAIKVVVKPGPVASFTAAGGCLRDTVNFTASSSTAGFTIASWLWNFDDGSTQTTIHAKKKFIAAGAQTVRYRIYADNGCAGDTSRVIYIKPEPVARPGAGSPGCSGNPVQITDTSSISSGSIASWQYLLGDGNTLVRNNGLPFQHTYNSPGTYIIKLVALSDSSCRSDTGYAAVTIFAKPAAKFGYDRNICAGDSIRITDSSSIAAGIITSWRYDFGDGTTAVNNTGAAFYHTYANAGSYVVKLAAISDMGCRSDTFSRTVFVSGKPVATAGALFAPCADSPVVFKSSYAFGSVPPVTYHWFFGDGSSRTITSADTAIHRYTVPSAAITARHFISVGAGCVSDTFTLTPIAIYPNPAAGFTAASDSFCADKPVTFTSTTATAGIAEWRWSWGDGFTLSTTPPPALHTYSAAGTYTVSLTVRSSNASGGCVSAPFSLPVTVYPRPRVNAGPDLYTQPGQPVVINGSVTGPGNFTLLWSNAATLSNATIANPAAAPQVTTTYVLTATEPVSKCAASDAVTVFAVSKLYIPNSFTPDGDGLHDSWRIPGMALYPDAQVTVYNRYGQKIYETRGYSNNPWDGSFKGQPVPSGGYVYMIQLNNPAKEVLNGVVLVLR